jgi:hypothetical protein
MTRLSNSPRAISHGRDIDTVSKAFASAAVAGLSRTGNQPRDYRTPKNPMTPKTANIGKIITAGGHNELVLIIHQKIMLFLS